MHMPIRWSRHLFISTVRNVSIEVSPDYLRSYHEVLDLSLLSWHSELQI